MQIPTYEQWRRRDLALRKARIRADIRALAHAYHRSYLYGTVEAESLSDLREQRDKPSDDPRP